MTSTAKIQLKDLLLKKYEEGSVLNRVKTFLNSAIDEPSTTEDKNSDMASIIDLNDLDSDDNSDSDSIDTNTSNDEINRISAITNEICLENKSDQIKTNNNKSIVEFDVYLVEDNDDNNINDNQNVVTNKQNLIEEIHNVNGTN